MVSLLWGARVAVPTSDLRQPTRSVYLRLDLLQHCHPLVGSSRDHRRCAPPEHKSHSTASKVRSPTNTTTEARESQRIIHTYVRIQYPLNKDIYNYIIDLLL